MKSLHCHALAALILSVGACPWANAQVASTCSGSQAAFVNAGVHAFDLRSIATPNATATPPCIPDAASNPSSYEQWLTYKPTSTGVAHFYFSNVSDGPATFSIQAAGCDSPGFSFECRNSDDICSPAGILKRAVIQDEPIIIQISGRGAGKPYGSLVIVENPAAPAGDLCETALPAALGATTYNAFASVEDLDLACFGYDDMWFVYVPPATGGLEASICDPNSQDDTIALYSSCSPVVALDCGNFNDDQTFPPCRARGGVTAGVPVYIRVTQTCYRDRQFTLTFIPNVIPANDECANAQSIALGDTLINNTFATTDGEDACGGGPFGFNSGRDLWYQFTPSITAQYDFTAGYDTVGLAAPIDAVALSVFDSCTAATVAPPNPVACASDGFSYTYFRTSLVAGTQYIIRVAGGGRPADNQPYGRGDVKLNIRRVVPPSNDLCTSPIAVSQGEFNFDLRDASPDGSPFCSQLPGIADLWFVHTPAASGPLEIGLVPSAAFPPDRLSAAEITIGADCEGMPTAAADIAFDSVTGDLNSRLIVQATAGVPIFVRIGGDVLYPQLSAGRLYIGPVRAPIPPANDLCAHAQSLAYGVPVAFSMTSSMKTYGPCYADSNCQTDACTTAVTSDIFFVHVAPQTGTSIIRVNDAEPYFDGTTYNAGAVLSVLSACGTQPSACALACGDFPRDSLTISTVAGQAYIIRVGAYSGAAWETFGGTLTVSCVSDFNGSGSTSIQDIFDFLNTWFMGDLRADVNADDVVSVQDIFDFLNIWFAGGC